MKMTISMNDFVDYNRLDILFQTAFTSGLNFFCYRLPGETEIHFGASGRIIPDISEDAYVVVPFDNNPDGIFSIPCDITASTLLSSDCYPKEMRNDRSGLYPFPESSTTKEQHREEILSFKSIINGNENHKIIAARVICGDECIDIAGTFKELCKSYPEAFIFLFNASPSGCWLGASPETVLSCINGRLSAMSLAGTRKSDSSEDKPWDEKNIREQRIVTEFIADLFKRRGLKTEISDTFTHKAGPVEHICTIIEANDPEATSADRKSLLLEMSPTPALNGFPADTAFLAINEMEGNQRGYYGGFSGWMTDRNNFRFFVNLRSMRIESHRWCIYAGGGITAASEPEKEWEETEIKASTLASKIKFIEKQ